MSHDIKSWGDNYIVFPNIEHYLTDRVYANPNAHQDPHCPWSLTGKNQFGHLILASNESGVLKELNYYVN